MSTPPERVVRVAALVSLFTLLLFAACHAPDPVGGDGSGDGADPYELSVMTFNIRYGTADDGDHAWPARRELVAARIADERPDVLALQEALAFQLAELNDVLTGYTKLGQHREGGTRGEFSGLYVHEARVEVVAWGELWLSPEPGEVASRGWDAALPRMAVWADLRLRDGGPDVRVYGTHYDHRGEVARRESSALLLRHVGDRPRVIVMGDFNATEDEPPVRTFLDAGWSSAWRTLHPDDTRGSFNGFQDPSGGRLIDHIFFRGLRPLDARILGGRVHGLFLSDHDAVAARFFVDRRASH